MAKRPRTRSAHRHRRNVTSRVRCKEIIRVISGVLQEYLVFEEVPFSDYTYIMDRLEEIGYKKTWNRLTYFPNSQRLVMSSPSAVHGFVLESIMTGLDRVLGTIAVPKTTLVFRTMTAKTIITDSIHAIPDLSIIMCTEGSRLGRLVCLMECAFSQSDCDVMRKLNTYVRDIPDLLVVGKILVKEAERYASPGSDSSVAPQLRSSDTMTGEEWGHDQGADEFHRVVVDGHTWFSLSSVEIHVWTRQAGRSEIEIDHSDGGEYAVGTLYPTVNLGDINRIFQRGLQLIKEDTFRELVDQSLLDRMAAWSPPPYVLDSTSLRDALVFGAWTTAYERYLCWRSELKSKP